MISTTDLAETLIALRQFCQRRVVEIEPRGRKVDRQTQWRRSSSQLKHVRRRREAEIKVQQAPQTFDRDAIQAPNFLVMADVVVDGPVSDKAANGPPSRRPAAVDLDAIGEASGAVVMQEHGGAAQPPAVAARTQASGVVSGSVQPSPKRIHVRDR